MSKRTEEEIERLIEHRPPMRVVEELRSVDDRSAESLATVRETWPTVDGGRARTLVLIELIAQTAAAWAGWKDRDSPDGPTHGYLVGVSKARIVQPFIPVGTRLHCRIQGSHGMRGYQSFDGVVVTEEGQQWLEASVQAYRTGRPPLFGVDK